MQKKSTRPTNYGRLLKQSVNQLNRAFDRFAAHHGLTGTQMSVIDYLSTQPGTRTSQRAIEAEFDIQRSTATILLQRMERKGFLTRTQDPGDGRQKIIQLTPAAHDLVDTVTTYIDNEQLAFEHEFGMTRTKEFTDMLAFFVQHRAHNEEDTEND
jgi:DNA-binding MarR family transcriptional regulator